MLSVTVFPQGVYMLLMKYNSKHRSAHQFALILVTLKYSNVYSNCVRTGSIVVTLYCMYVTEELHHKQPHEHKINTDRERQTFFERYYFYYETSFDQGMDACMSYWVWMVQEVMHVLLVQELSHYHL